jgi:DNA processing protein
MTLSERERLQWLRLARSENVGPVTFFRLIERFGSAAAALDALPDLAAKGGRRIVACSEAEASAELEATAKAGARLIAHGESDYPPLLARIEDAPPLIALIGNTHLLTKRALAIVGTRDASINALRLARDFASAIGKSGLLIVSGMARGIDGAAHEGALESGTVAVLGSGVDVPYPKENAKLYDRIAAQGAIVSELPLGAEPHARNFPRRNRIISGIARGVLVVEAARRSGSLVTARLALEQNREVLAIPGSPLDPRAQGANDLIRDGAHLVQAPEDVIEVLNGLFQSRLEEPPGSGHLRKTPQVPAEKELETARQTIVGYLGPAPTAVDELIRQCQMSPAVVTTVLLELELAGRLERHPGNRVSLLITP